MNKENINRLKRYLFLISIFFSFVIWWHIIYVYLYDEAKESPIEWGSVSEWIIGEFPHLNPLLMSSDYNKNVLSLLYRSLLTFDYTKNEITSDLANCNLKNLWYIECFLKDNIFWSNGEKITADDVIATYNIIKNSDINNTLWALIKDTTIENRAWVITFSNTVKDINFLTVLFQPIVAKNVLDNIGNKELYGKFNPIDGLYSWPYLIETVSYDDSLWIQKLILAKNTFYKEKEILIWKYIYKIFKDQNHFLKHKDLINIFFDKNKIIGDTLPRLAKNTFFLNQYNALFINEERIKSPLLRNFILGKIDVNNIINHLWKSYASTQSIFLDDSVLQNYDIKNTNIESIIKEMWYYKKDYLANIIAEEEKQKIETTKITNPNLSYITSPSTSKYSFSSENNILIEWKTLWKTPDEIYINEYKLSAYKKWDPTFYYRLKTDFNNISAGVNTYKIYFVSAGKKEFMEEFVITYSSDKEKLAKIQSEFEKKLKESENQPWITFNQEKKQKILALSDNAFYDKDLKKLSFRIYYIENREELVNVVNIIKNILESYSLWIEAIPISIVDLNKKIISEEKDYDMILVWLDLWYFPFHLYPYFHSSQAKWWYNFSNIKNLNLDILLEELKSNILSKEKTIQLAQKANEILAEKQIVKPIYSKENIVLVDNSIKNFSLPTGRISDEAIMNSILKSYVSSERTIDFSQKNFWDFVRFIKKVFFNE